MTLGIRVTLQEEIGGLDIGEHGNSAYPDFVVRKSLPVSASVEAMAATEPANKR